ncbi:MAG: class I tRNA ligase family protein [Candidatus Yanofskybacteria bacterium]|nr:class I tRNA ligase family protein [Candidatus Yanofskybacteria bacterium]
MEKYDPAKIERKWQQYWEKEKLYQTSDSGKGDPPSRKASGGRGNYMLLTEFPYPSGNLHIGHWYAFALPDILARYLRMTGKNVMYPIGFDAFGLPAENAAIQRNINPRDWTEENIKYMSKQLRSMGASFDWEREVRTIDPDYYKWTQWLFLQLFKKGLAYRAMTKANWCPKDKTVLANEQVVDGCCERCGTQVEQKEIEQWMMRITDYADRLLDELEELDWPKTTKLAQKNWIGRSQGALITFKLVNIPGQDDEKHFVEVFTTRPDTIYGATFIVISPELAQKWLDIGWQASNEVKKYVNEALTKREFERLEQKEKTGVDAGIVAINPATEKKISVWVADYVVGSYGTGAIMAVPAYDERDREFAEKFKLPIKKAKLEDTEKITKELEQKGLGQKKTTYRLHDWLISRQRYWGVPIPVIRCNDCGYVPVPEDELPVELPQLDDFKPSDAGRSPLAKAESWVKVSCPTCGKEGERETDTMDTFVDSSWYFLRYTDPKNRKQFADPEKMKQWLPVPLYIGGAEHNTMHLLYSRFFTKALYDLGLVHFNEPFLIRRNHGIILGPDSQKMSKSRGNVVDPDLEVEKYGSDTVRMYLAFMGPYDQDGPWDPKGISGVYRFLHRVWKLVHVFSGKGKEAVGEKVDLLFNKAIKNISEDIAELKFNTGVSELMKLLNGLEEEVGEKQKLSQESYMTLVRLLAPFAPHIAEELWCGVLEQENSVHAAQWPDYNESLLAKQTVTMPIQVNGKVRDSLQVPWDSPEDHLKKLALESERVKQHIKDKKVKKIIIIPGRMISIVVH